MSEAERIIEKYFQKDNTAIVYYNLDQNIFNQVIKHIGKYEKPDMLSIFDNNIIAIEHFEFDSFKRSRKGSDFQIKHNNMNNQFKEIIDKELTTKDYVTIHGQIKSTASLNNYYENFKHNFISHYDKIDSYINHIQEDFGKNKEIKICFFAEDVTPLGNYFLNRKTSSSPYLLHPLYSNDIIDLLINSPKVEYLIIGTYAMSDYKLIIIENRKEVLEKFKQEKIDFKEEDYFVFEPQTTGFATKIPKDND